MDVTGLQQPQAFHVGSGVHQRSASRLTATRSASVAEAPSRCGVLFCRRHRVIATMDSSASIWRLRPLAYSRAALFIGIEALALFCRRHLEVDLAVLGRQTDLSLAVFGPMSWAFLVNDRITYRSAVRWRNAKPLRYLRFCTCCAWDCCLASRRVFLWEIVLNSNSTACG